MEYSRRDRVAAEVGSEITQLEAVLEMFSLVETRSRERSNYPESAVLESGMQASQATA